MCKSVEVGNFLVVEGIKCWYSIYPDIIRGLSDIVNPNLPRGISQLFNYKLSAKYLHHISYQPIVVKARP